MSQLLTVSTETNTLARQLAPVIRLFPAAVSAGDINRLAAAAGGATYTSGLARTLALLPRIIGNTSLASVLGAGYFNFIPDIITTQATAKEQQPVGVEGMQSVFEILSRLRRSEVNPAIDSLGQVLPSLRNLTAGDPPFAQHLVSLYDACNVKAKYHLFETKPSFLRALNWLCSHPETFAFFSGCRASRFSRSFVLWEHPHQTKWLHEDSTCLQIKQASQDLTRI